MKPRLGGLKLSKLTVYHVEQLYAQMEREDVSAALRRKIGTTLGTALRHAVRIRLMPFNPVADIRKPQAAKPEIQVWTGEQVGKFLETAAVDRLAALYTLAIDSGMRQGELLALHWPDVDFAGNAVSVRRSLEEIGSGLRLKEVKTKRSRRKIELTAATMAALNQHRQVMLAEGQEVKEGLVFCNADGSLIRKHVV